MTKAGRWWLTSSCAEITHGGRGMGQRSLAAGYRERAQRAGERGFFSMQGRGWATVCGVLVNLGSDHCVKDAGIF